MPVDLDFDAGSHVYKLGGRIIPSVTGLLKDAGIIKFGINGSELENNITMSRGKAVHAACQYLDDGNLDWSTVQDDIVPFVMAYESFKKETGFKPDRNEERLVNATLGFAGTLDREGTVPTDKRRWLIDLKTGNSSPFHGVQLAGYDILLPTLSLPRRRFTVELKDDATFRLKEYTNPSDKDIFFAALALHNWKLNNA